MSMSGKYGPGMTAPPAHLDDKIRYGVMLRMDLSGGLPSEGHARFNEQGFISRDTPADDETFRYTWQTSRRVTAPLQDVVADLFQDVRRMTELYGLTCRLRAVDVRVEPEAAQDRDRPAQRPSGRDPEKINGMPYGG